MVQIIIDVKDRFGDLSEQMFLVFVKVLVKSKDFVFQVDDGIES